MKRHFSLKQEVHSIVDSAVAKAQFDLKKYIDKQLDTKFHDIADAVDLAETKLRNKQTSPNGLNGFDLSMYDMSNEWVSYETANSNESELSAEEQLLNEQKNQIDLGVVTCKTPEPEKAYSECVVLELQSTIDQLNHELKKYKQQLEIADKKNEKLVQLLQATPGTGNADRAEEAASSDSQSTYIVFNRTNLTDFLKTTDLDTVMSHILLSENHNFAYVYDRIIDQLQGRNVAAFHDYYIIEIPN